MRWVQELAEFNFEIKYHPGKHKVNADALSRLASDFAGYMMKCENKITSEEFQSLVTSTLASERGEGTWITSLTVEPNALEPEQEY